MAAVGIGSVTTAALTGGGSTTFSFTSTSQPLYLLIPRWRNLQTISGATFNGSALTRVAQSTPSNGDDAVEIWRILAPTATTANIVISHAGGPGSGTVAAFNTTGQATSTPEGTAVTNASGSNGTDTGALAISGMVTGDLVIVGIANGAGAAIAPAATGGSDLTEFYDTASGGEESEGFRVSDTVTDVSGSWTGATAWAIAAIPLKTATPPPASVQPDTPTWGFPHPPIRVS